MKKFFLPLLALVGMVAGFTLCSCGGGGGKNDGPARALTNMTVRLGSTPWLTYQFGEVTSTHSLFVNVIAGNPNPNGNSVDPGLTAEFSIIGWSKDSQGRWVITGDVSFGSVVDEMQDNKEFLAYLGVAANADSVVLDGFRVQFCIPEDEGQATGEAITALNGGTYWFEDSTEGTKIDERTLKTTLRYTGKLKTQYLKGEGAENGDSDLWVPGTI